MPMLNISPPIMSVIQCTPDNILPKTIKRINAIIVAHSARFKIVFLIREFTCFIAVGITVVTSSVVEDG